MARYKATARRIKAAGQKLKEFEEALVEFEKRLGYTFANRELLHQVFTHPSFNVQRDGVAIDNRRLEAEGDEILKQRVRQTVYGALPCQHEASRHVLGAFLNSNVYLSVIGMGLGMDLCARLSVEQAQAASKETQVRITANMVEALIAAVERDGTSTATNVLFSRHILPIDRSDSLVRKLHTVTTASTLNDLKAAIESIVDTRADIAVHIDASKPYVRVGTKVQVLRSDISATDTLLDTALRFFYEEYWILWGFDGPVSLHLPCKTKHWYGDVPTDQSRYRSGLPRHFSSLESVGTNSVASAIPENRYREERGWDLLELPAMQSISSVDRGPYVDKLRHLAGVKQVEVRVRLSRKDDCPRFAFFVGDEHLITVKDRRTINDAAKQAIRELVAADTEP